jgi:uncharacterized protein YbcI
VIRDINPQSAGAPESCAGRRDPHAATRGAVVGSASPHAARERRPHLRLQPGLRFAGHGNSVPSGGVAVSSSDVQDPPRAHGDVLTAISDGMVALLKEFYGHGPTRTKSYYADDLVVCVLRGGFSRVEQTLLEGGRGAAVIDQRIAFQDLMRQRFEAVIESATGRRVIGFMSGNQQHPDMMCEVFILAPTDLVDHHEIAAADPAPAAA